MKTLVEQTAELLDSAPEKTNENIVVDMKNIQLIYDVFGPVFFGAQKESISEALEKISEKDLDNSEDHTMRAFVGLTQSAAKHMKIVPAVKEEIANSTTGVAVADKVMTKKPLKRYFTVPGSVFDNYREHISKPEYEELNKHLNEEDSIAVLVHAYTGAKKGIKFKK